MALTLLISFKSNEHELYEKIKNHILGPSMYLKILVANDLENKQGSNTIINIVSNEINNKNKLIKEEDIDVDIYTPDKNVTEDSITFDWS